MKLDERIWEYNKNIEIQQIDYIEEPDSQQEKVMSKDIQIGGNHYKNLEIQPIDYILGNQLGYAEGNVVKYVSRWRDKGGIEDLRKAKQYIDFLIADETKI
jgi:hypothetical protein